MFTVLMFGQRFTEPSLGTRDSGLEHDQSDLASLRSPTLQRNNLPRLTPLRTDGGQYQRKLQPGTATLHPPPSTKLEVGHVCLLFCLSVCLVVWWLSWCKTRFTLLVSEVNGSSARLLLLPSLCCYSCRVSASRCGVVVWFFCECGVKFVQDVC